MIPATRSYAGSIPASPATQGIFTAWATSVVLAAEVLWVKIHPGMTGQSMRFSNIVMVRISGFHPGGPGSIPGMGNYLPCAQSMSRRNERVLEKRPAGAARSNAN